MFGMTFLVCDPVPSPLRLLSILTGNYTGKELWCGQIPFPSQKDAEVIIMLSKQQLFDYSGLTAERPEFMVFKERVLSICSLCWIMDPVNRPSMGTIEAIMRCVYIDGICPLHLISNLF